MIAIRAMRIALLSLFPDSALILRMHAENNVNGYGVPWKMLLTTASDRLGVASDCFPLRVTAASMLFIPIYGFPSLRVSIISMSSK